MPHMNDHALSQAAQKLKRRFVTEANHDLPEWALITAILGWEVETDRFDEASLESDEFLTYLDEHVRRVKEAAMYTGGLPFSFRKLAGVMSYIAARGHDVSKTKLNKLLFYCDFVNYFLHGASISGSRYLHMPYGPVAEYYRETIETLSEDSRLKTQRSGGHDKLLADNDSLHELSFFEVATINWVLDNLDSMTAAKISELSHQERAFRFTRQGEFIPYEFAKYLKKLPEPIPPGSIPPINGH
jgi:uncharacterized phage-associated protein